MLRHKRIPHRVVRFMPGLHPLLVRLRRLRAPHRPGARARRAQGAGQPRRSPASSTGSRPTRRCSPPTPRHARAVEEAERWGERVLQPVPRRLFRYLMRHEPRTRGSGWAARSCALPAAARRCSSLFMPVIRAAGAGLARRRGARAGRPSRRLPALLDHVDALIADGTIGGAEPNAADFQILASVRVLLEFEDLGRAARGPAVRGRARVALSRTGQGRSRAACRGQLSDGSAGIVAISR